MKINIHTEFMKNQVGAATMKPDKGFDVIQTLDGTALHFSIAKGEGVLRLTHESKSRTGWQQSDLSTRVSKDWHNKVPLAKDFAISQNNHNSKKLLFDMVMVISVDDEDYLYVSLGNDVGSATALAKNLTWTKVAWPAGPKPSQVSVSDVFIYNSTYVDNDTDESNTSSTIFADLVAPSSVNHLLDRYWIDTSDPSKPAWSPNPIPLDISSQGHVSCAGSRLNSFNDGCGGIYTFGQLKGDQTLMYAPQHDQTDYTAPGDPIYFNFPQGATTIASQPLNDGSGATNLFLAAPGAVYIYEAALQQDTQNQDGTITKPNPVPVYQAQNTVESGLLANVTDMIVNTLNNRTVVWCRNTDAKLFYISCPVGKESTAKWSRPLPICSEVDEFAFYLNANASNNVVFTANYAKASLGRLTQNPVSTVWHETDVLLPTSDYTAMSQQPTYTTQIKITDDNGLPMPHASVTITATNQMRATINNAVHLLEGGQPLSVAANSSGGIDFVEFLNNSMDGSCFQVTASDGTVTHVKPMTKAYSTLSGIKDVKTLKAVHIPNEQGTPPKPMVNGASDANLQDTVTAIGNLMTATTSLPENGGKATPSKQLSAQMQLHDQSILGGIVSFFGDLLRAAEHAAESVAAGVVGFIESAADGFYYLTVKLGGILYTAALDCISAVSRATQFVFKQIEVLVDELIAWLGFLFMWPDIVFTHKVLRGVFVNYIKHVQTDGLQSIKTNLDKMFNGLAGKVDSYINKNGPPPEIQNAIKASKTLGDQVQQGPSSSSYHASSPQAHWGINQFHNNASSADSSHDFTDPTESVLEKLIDDFETAIGSEVQDLDNLISQIRTTIIEKIATLKPLEAALQVLAILAEFLLKSGEVLFDAVIGVAEILMSAATDLLTVTIEIPVISNLYEKFAGEKLSFLDVACLICAVPVTVVYKAIKRKAPFSSTDPAASAIVTATSWAQVRTALGTATSSTNNKTPAPLQQRNNTLDISPSDEVVKILTFSFDIAACIGAVAVDFLTVIKALESEGQADWANPKIFSVLNIVAWLIYASPNITSAFTPLELPRDAFESGAWVGYTNGAISLLAAAKVVIDNAFVMKGGPWPNSIRQKYMTTASPWVDCAINFFWVIPALGGMFYMDVKKPSNWLALGGNVSFDFGGVLSPGTLDEEPATKTAFVAAIALANQIYGRCMLASGICLILDE
jgi:hypothetical protein